jgi:hypothetical protein
MLPPFWGIGGDGGGMFLQSIGNHSQYYLSHKPEDHNVYFHCCEYLGFHVICTSFNVSTLRKGECLMVVQLNFQFQED